MYQRNSYMHVMYPVNQIHSCRYTQWINHTHCMYICIVNHTHASDTHSESYTHTCRYAHCSGILKHSVPSVLVLGYAWCDDKLPAPPNDLLTSTKAIQVTCFIGCGLIQTSWIELFYGVCVSVCLCAHAHVCTSTWRPEDNLRHFSSNSYHIFLERISHWSGTHQRY